MSSHGRGLGAALAIFVVCGVPAWNATAQISSEVAQCSEPDGTTYRVSYHLDPRGVFGPQIDVDRIEVSARPEGPFSTYRDDARTRARLESWTPATFDALFLQQPDAFSFPFVTLALDVQGYRQWWVNADGVDAIRSSPRVTYLNPRLQLRTPRSTANPADPDDLLSRGSDRCTVYLGSYAGAAGGARVALLGDSIGDQMAPRLFQRLSDRRFFFDAQSGQGFQSMLGEARGVAAGVRDPDGSGPFVPDVLVAELGTNDAGGFLLRPSETADQFELRVALVLLRYLFDTQGVPCRVLMTVRTSGADPAPFGNPRLLVAQRRLNALIRSIVSGDPDAFRLVDFEAMSETHRPGGADSWFDPPLFGPPGSIDTVHPNAAGLRALADEITAQVAACVGE